MNGPNDRTGQYHISLRTATDIECETVQRGVM